MCAVGAGPGAGEGLLLLLMAHKLPTLWPTEEAIQTLDHPFPKHNCGEPCQRSFDLIWPRPAFLPFQTFYVRVCLPLPALRSFTGHRLLSAEALPVLRYPGPVPCVGRSFVSSETREVGRRSPSKVAKDSLPLAPGLSLLLPGDVMPLSASGQTRSFPVPLRPPPSKWVLVPPLSPAPLHRHTPPADKNTGAARTLLPFIAELPPVKLWSVGMVRCRRGTRAVECASEYLSALSPTL